MGWLSNRLIVLNSVLVFFLYYLHWWAGIGTPVHYPSVLLFVSLSVKLPTCWLCFNRWQLFPFEISCSLNVFPQNYTCGLCSVRNNVIYKECDGTFFIQVKFTRTWTLLGIAPLTRKDSCDFLFILQGGREVDDFIKYLAKESTNELQKYTRDGKKKKSKKSEL